MTHRYNMDCSVYLVQEEDGLRIIGNDTHEFLQKVPGRHTIQMLSFSHGVSKLVQGFSSRVNLNTPCIVLRFDFMLDTDIARSDNRVPFSGLRISSLKTAFSLVAHLNHLFTVKIVYPSFHPVI